jgi:D-amino peptidase
MKLHILCDLEGAAGVVDFETQTYGNAPGLTDARRLATLELNALIDGCIDAGATEILVLDGHGSGGLIYELLHPEAKMIMGRPFTDYGLDESVDAMLLYGHHAMNNVPNAVLCHSWSSKAIDNCWLNGDLVGEIGFNMALAGECNIPTIFVSGDRATIEESRRYVPNIEAVETKVGLSRTSAICLAPEKSRQLHRQGGKRAVERISEIKPYRVDPPYEFTTQWYSDALSKRFNHRIDHTRVDDQTFTIKADTLRDVAQRRL